MPRKPKSIEELRNLQVGRIRKAKPRPGTPENPINIKTFQGPAGERIDRAFEKLGVPSGSVSPVVKVSSDVDQDTAALLEAGNEARVQQDFVDNALRTMPQDEVDAFLDAVNKNPEIPPFELLKRRLQMFEAQTK